MNELLIMLAVLFVGVMTIGAVLLVVGNCDRLLVRSYLALRKRLTTWLNKQSKSQ